MDHDDNTRRDGYGTPGSVRPSTRVTATAASVRHGPAPAHAVDELSPPRTVGGGTVRLQAPTDEALAAAAARVEPAPRQFGGTMRMPTAPPMAQPPAAPLVQEPAPAPPLAVTPRARESEGGTALLSPLAVGVGLIFLAMGSMLALAIDRRSPRSEAPAAGTSASARPEGAAAAPPTLATAAPTGQEAAPARAPASAIATATATAHATAHEVALPPAPPPSSEPPPRKEAIAPEPPAPFGKRGGGPSRPPPSPPGKPKAQPFSPND